MKSQDLFLLLALAVVIGMMFFNSRKRKKAAAEMQTGIKVGAYVLLHSGILGSIISVDEKSIVIESTPGTKLTVLKAAIRSFEEAPKKPAVKAAAKPAVKSATSSATKPAAKTVAKPAAKKPAAKKPAAKPAQ